MLFNQKLHERIAQLEQQLGQLQGLFHALDETTARAEFDLEGKHLDSNPLFQRMLGLEGMALSGLQHRQLCDAAYADSGEYNRFWENVRNGKPFSGRVNRRHHNGSPVWLEATYNPVKNSSGQVTHIVVYCADATQRVLTSNRNRALIAALNQVMAVMEFSVEGQVTSANTIFQDVLGYSDKELVGQPHNQLCPPEPGQTADAQRSLWSGLKAGRFFAGRMRNVAKNGEERWLQANYIPVADDKGNVVSVIEFATDITAHALRQKEERDSALLAFNTSQQTKSWANEGVEQIQESVGRVEHMAKEIEQTGKEVQSLGDHSQQISSIVQTIKDIADQTNLLALNAAIEAARAGETGRGFAVVADEVRKLAERTSSSTTQISTMVSSIQQQTVNAVKGMDQIRSQVEDTATQFGKVGEVINQIHAGAESVVAAVEKVANQRD